MLLFVSGVFLAPLESRVFSAAFYIWSIKFKLFYTFNMQKIGTIFYFNLPNKDFKLDNSLK